MENFKSVFGDLTVAAYKLYSQYSFYVGKVPPNIQNLSIKIYIQLNGMFSYSLSHHYKGTKQMGPYTSSITHNFNDERSALEGARRELFSFYDEDDIEAQWIPYEFF